MVSVLRRFHCTLVSFCITPFVLIPHNSDICIPKHFMQDFRYLRYSLCQTNWMSFNLINLILILSVLSQDSTIIETILFRRYPSRYFHVSQQNIWSFVTTITTTTTNNLVIRYFIFIRIRFSTDSGHQEEPEFNNNNKNSKEQRVRWIRSFRRIRSHRKYREQ